MSVKSMESWQRQESYAYELVSHTSIDSLPGAWLFPIPYAACDSAVQIMSTFKAGPVVLATIAADFVS
jgi:hypothetical protein